MTSFSALAPDRQTTLQWLAENLPLSRIQHTLGVEAMAIALAQHYQLDVDQASQAALMHDVAKFFHPQCLLDLAQAEGLPLDPVDFEHPHLLHARVGALVARDQLGVRDQAVLRAIANHTLGEPGMDVLSRVIFVADSLEAGRGDTPELDQLRQACYDNLDRAVWMTCDYSIQRLIRKHRLIHPYTVLTRNGFLQLPHAKQAIASPHAHLTP